MLDTNSSVSPNSCPAYKVDEIFLKFKWNVIKTSNLDCKHFSTNLLFSIKFSIKLFYKKPSNNSLKYVQKFCFNSFGLCFY